MRSVLRPMMSARPPAAPQTRIRHVAGYAQTAPRHSPRTSAPLQASVTSIGIAGAPSRRVASHPCEPVSGSNRCASTHSSRTSPNQTRLQATKRTAKLCAGVQPRLTPGIDLSGSGVERTEHTSLDAANDDLTGSQKAAKMLGPRPIVAGLAAIEIERGETAL